MILRANGSSVPADSVFKAFTLSNEGASVTEVIRVARLFGLQASAWRTPRSELSDIPLPLMLFIDNDHFVVLDSIRSDTLFVRDPAGGADQISLDALEGRWNGVMIRF
jgi:ABC-type bacteriocin/lantibiotic exporter with double-glycine peptidase domain